jgi:hypothetical protein
VCRKLGIWYSEQPPAGMGLGGSRERQGAWNKQMGRIMSVLRDGAIKVKKYKVGGSHSRAGPVNRTA